MGELTYKILDADNHFKNTRVLRSAFIDHQINRCAELFETTGVSALA